MDLFEQLKPRVFVDQMVGSGTSIEIAQEMGIEAHGLDLHSGFNQHPKDFASNEGVWQISAAA
jgi:hypothetical protein